MARTIVRWKRSKGLGRGSLTGSRDGAYRRCGSGGGDQVDQPGQRRFHRRARGPHARSPAKVKRRRPVRALPARPSRSTPSRPAWPAYRRPDPPRRSPTARNRHGFAQRAPSAIAMATASETAPCSSIRSDGTPSISCFASFEYVTNPRSNQSELPATAVMAPATSPPVHDSAVATRHPAIEQPASEIGGEPSVPLHLRHDPNTRCPIASTISV